LWDCESESRIAISGLVNKIFAKEFFRAGNNEEFHVPEKFRKKYQKIENNSVILPVKSDLPYLDSFMRYLQKNFSELSLHCSQKFSMSRCRSWKSHADVSDWESGDHVEAVRRNVDMTLAHLYRIMNQPVADLL
jgi:hypothetical protein